MQSNKLTTLLVAAIPLFGAFFAAPAEAAEGGPVWHVARSGGESASNLLAGETRAVTATGATTFAFKTTSAEIKCKKLEGTGLIVGGVPGTDSEKFTFKECAVSGKTVAECGAKGLKPLAASNAGEFSAPALTSLAFPESSTKAVLEALLPEGEAGNPNLFVEFELSGTNCGVLNKIKVKITATGTESEVKTMKRKCGALAEVGKGSTSFESLVAGESTLAGLLRLPESPLTKAELWEVSGKSFKKIECKMEAGTLGKAEETGTAKLETSPAENFGWGEVVPPTPPTTEQVNFTKNLAVLVDHRANSTPETAMAIEQYGEGNNVEWQTGANQKNWPVAYVQNTKIKLQEVRFTVGAATRAFLNERIEPGSMVKFAGELTLGANKLTFDKELTVAEVTAQLVAHAGYLAAKEMESNVALPKEVRLYEGAKIVWKWTVKEKGNTFEQELGASEHNIYLTFASPVKQKYDGQEYEVPFYLTVLDSDTQGIEKTTAVQPPAEAGVINGIWSEYETRKLGIRWYNVATGVIHRGGLLLQYYEEIATGKTPKEVKEVGFRNCEIAGVQGLLENGKSQCHGWSEIFSFGLADEGVSSVTQEVFPEFGGAGECPATVECWFLVKNWKFNGMPGMGTFPYENAQVEDIAGVEGQGGVKNPTSVFTRHFIVEAKKGSTKLFDPSYGSEPVEGANRLKEYQEKYIEGFCNPGLEKCQKAPAALQLKTKEYETYE
jgi:hypothetical protein